jgi:starch-binding outer membrane protein, SusD/RagB family
VRNYQGAGLTATPTADALTVKEELRRERRVALAFRGLAFYDARRWGIIDPVSVGGGCSGAVVLDKDGVVSTNATINYNFLDYWDVPDNELVYNKPSADSAPVTNPRTN